MLKVSVGDRVALRKPHPCGSYEWIVYRVGADIGLRCTGCERTVLLSRGVFNKRLKRVIAPAAGDPADAGRDLEKKTQNHVEE
jgi:hypothetical protein